MLVSPLMFGPTLLLLAATSSGAPQAPRAEDLAESRSWTLAKFEGVVPARPTTPGLIVLANHGVVCKNARGDRPMKIVDKPYARGLYCHATSKVVVRLPSPGKCLSAVAGVDTNDQTSGGRGSVVFSVTVGGKGAFRTGVMREGMPGVPVQVDLNGATEFTLEVGDAGDGISCDQADWVDAQVTLAGGETLWLGDMPIIAQGRQPYSTDPPFSFAYGGKPSGELLTSWGLERHSRKLDEVRTERTITCTDPASKLTVRCVGVEYRDYPTVEWTLYFKNHGMADSPILSDVQAIDTVFERGGQTEFALYHNRGDDCTPTSYEPLQTTLGPKATARFAPAGGRPTNGAFPYYNLSMGDEGVVVVLSWAGQWAAQLARDEGNTLRFRGGQERTHFKLHPGEEVRGPMVVVQFYKGDWLRGQNIWRRWMVAHNLRKIGGRTIRPQLSICTGNYYPGLMSNAAQEIAFLRQYVEQGIKVDNWWQDAGWYPCDGVTWPKTGTWEVDPVRFPKGLREVGDFARSHGVKTLVWFEPERVHAGTWLTENHPEWIHGGKNGGLLRLDDPNCRVWLTDHIDKIITEQKIDFYRQDFNIDPLDFWRRNDAPDRQGITEIRHVEGYFAYWDELIRRHPDMPIDSCASGGRRNDLETMRRSVPLLRSDWYASPSGQQCQTYGMSLWLPFQGTGVIHEKDEYWSRSSLVAEFSFGPGSEGLQVVDFKRLRRVLDAWRRLADYILGDFYPLMPYTQSTDTWMAWQYDRPDAGGGAVQVFRRETSVYEAARFKLKGLDPQAIYTLEDLDQPEPRRASGAELMDKGLSVSLKDAGSAAIIVYKRATP